MKLYVEWEINEGCDEDWVLGLLYMSDDEIAERGLAPNNYDGGDYDWITLPPRTEELPRGIPADHHLVAAYGGAATELAKWGPGSCAPSTDHEGAYYTEGRLEVSEHSLDCIPRDIADTLVNSIKGTERYGVGKGIEIL